MVLRYLDNAIICLFVIISFFSVFSSCYAQPAGSDEEMFYVHAKQTPLKEVIDSISLQTGYVIKVEESLTEFPVSGEFEESSIENVFRRIFRKKNIAILISEKEKICTIQTFDQKDKVYYTSKRFEPLVGMESNEIGVIQEQQKKEFQDYSKDPDSLDPIVGLTLGEIDSIQEEQRDSFEVYSEDPESWDPVIGATLGNLNTLQQKQQEQYKAYSENKESEDYSLGMKFGEVQTLQQKQEEAFRVYSENPESIDPMTGLTLGRLKEIADQQQRAFLGKNYSALEN